MPVYEFNCKNCDIVFDKLCKIGQSVGIECPDCGGSDIVRVMSVFSSGKSSSGHCSGSCSCDSSGGCGGSCGSGC